MAEAGETSATPQPDVAAILEGLRAEVRAQRLAQPQAQQSPIERDLQRSLDDIELYRVISAHWPLLGKTIPQRIIALVNKVVRRYLRWYINPIVEQQNAYNDTVARTLRLLAEAYADLGEQITQAQEARATRPEMAPGRDDDQPPPAGPHAERAAKAEGAQPTHAAAQHVIPFAKLNAQTPFQELEAIVRERAAAEPPARFPDLELRALEPQLRLRQEVSAHWPLPGTTVPLRIIALINKTVRRYLRWYINPLVEQQNAANAAFTAALLHTIRLDAARRAETAHVRSEELRVQS